MAGKVVRIGVVAPGNRIDPEVAAGVKALSEATFPGRVEEVFHPQCFLSARHFAGEDSARAAAFVEVANDPSLDAIWFAAGGYGACRMAEAALAQLNQHARAKTYLGYSDAIRACLPDAGTYTFWDYQAGAWPRNDGIRIDHLLLSPQATDRLVSAGIDRHTRGWEKPSDHVPVWLDLEL